MGTIILTIAFVVEIAFAVYCLVTKSGQQKLKSYIAVGAFAAFVLFALVSVIQWSFRWYLLGGLLFLWAIIGSIRLVGKKVDTKPFSALRTVSNAIGVLLLVFITVIPALILPQFTLPAPTGKYEIATASFTYTDESRVETFTNTGEKRQVNVKFWYPKDAEGAYPLVVFSHGTGGIKISNTSTFMDLASNGYVVCSIDHPYHSQFTIGADGRFVRMDPAYWQEYLDVVNRKYTDEGTRLQITLKWLALRTADMNFVVDTILAQVKDSKSAEVYHLIDPTKIGLMGHSIGGAEAAQVARERSDISAVINLDGDLNGEYLDFVNGAEVLNDKPFPVSILNIFTDDMARLIDKFPNPSEIVAAEHVLLTAPHGYDVRLTGANHFNVTDLPLVAPIFVSMMRSDVPGVGGAAADPYATIEKMNGIVLQFFNAYLKGEGAFSAAGTY
jgi:predicted dienelactone hydrolase